VGLGHERGAALVSGRDDPDPRVAQPLEEPEEALARHGERVADAGGAQGVGDEAPDRPGTVGFTPGLGRRRLGGRGLGLGGRVGALCWLGLGLNARLGLACRLGLRRGLARARRLSGDDVSARRLGGDDVRARRFGGLGPFRLGVDRGLVDPPGAAGGDTANVATMPTTTAMATMIMIVRA
jgi:hypothetical protein